jgi:hypothetical protein
LARLTFIADPAILTNASSILALGTSNRFAQAAEGAKSLAELTLRTNCALRAWHPLNNGSGSLCGR